MLIEVRLVHSIDQLGYDSDASELVHISADRVAVVSFVHDRNGIGLEVGFEQAFGLIKVRDVGSGQDET